MSTKPKKICKRQARDTIHPALKARLGYDSNASDTEVLRDWRARLRRVCKQCWELKYCPYGPLVEQSPTIPSLLKDAVEHNEYFKQCLKTNLVGTIETLSPEGRAQYETWMNDEQIVLKQARHRLSQHRQLAEAGKHTTDEGKIAAWLGGPLPPIHIYRTPYDYEDSNVEQSDYSAEDWAELANLAEQIRQEYRLALETGVVDHRKPLEPARAAWFRRRLEEFDPSKYPDAVPSIFYDAECNVYGHVCPVFFAAEALQRRRQQNADEAAIFLLT